MKTWRQRIREATDTMDHQRSYSVSGHLVAGCCASVYMVGWTLLYTGSV